jgi:hypothetical protein
MSRVEQRRDPIFRIRTCRRKGTEAGPLLNRGIIRVLCLDPGLQNAHLAFLSSEDKPEEALLRLLRGRARLIQSSLSRSGMSICMTCLANDLIKVCGNSGGQGLRSRCRQFCCRYTLWYGHTETPSVGPAPSSIWRGSGRLCPAVGRKQASV